MKKYIVMGVFAMGLTVLAASGFAEGREIYNWRASVDAGSNAAQVSPAMEALMFPDQPGEIYGWNNGASAATSSREHATTKADCVMARSYPKRSGGADLHKRVHANHDDSACD